MSAKGLGRVKTLWRMPENSQLLAFQHGSFPFTDFGQLAAILITVRQALPLGRLSRR
jgi:hypothetical protein